MICHIAAVVANKGRRWNDGSCGTGNVAAWRKRSVLRLAFRARCTGATRSDSSPPGRDRRGSGEIFLGSVARRGSWCRLFEPGAHDADGGSGKTAVGPVVARKSSIEAGRKKLVKNRRKKERESKDGGFVRQSRERLCWRRRTDTGRVERVEPEARWLERKRKENKWQETRGLNEDESTRSRVIRWKFMWLFCVQMSRCNIVVIEEFKC